MKKLSPTMMRVIELAGSKGGTLRWRGFWLLDGYGRFIVRDSTVHALVTRGLAKYTNWDPNFGLPVEVTLVRQVWTEAQVKHVYSPIIPYQTYLQGR